MIVVYKPISNIIGFVMNSTSGVNLFKLEEQHERLYPSSLLREKV